MTTSFFPFRFQTPSAGPGNQPAIWTFLDWSILSLLLLIAAALRLAFFNGFFGSDDLTYLERSTQISQGIWSSANYNGALRYGYNIPAAFFIYLFGLNAFTANMWTFLCSLGEVALVYFFATRFIGRRAAVFAALVLACIPLHIALGTRIHADPVFAFFLTLAFVLFYMAEQSSSRRLYFATGLAMGMIFWVKELGVITFLAFVSYPILALRLNREWVWIIGGGLVMLVGHLILMQIIADDPLHLIKTVTGQVQSSFIQSGIGEDGAGYYFKYLFLDIKHTWLAPFLSVAAIAGLLFHWQKQTRSDVSIYIAWWLLALLIVLSFTPVSLNPMRLAMKQSNYLNLFLAPIALLSGTMLASMYSRAMRNMVVLVTIFGGIVLGALEQHAYHVFTANSKAAVDFIKAHPDNWIIGSVNNGNIAKIMSILDKDPHLAERFGYLASDFKIDEDKAPAVWRKSKGYAVLDLETIHWGNADVKPDKAPPCWQSVAQLKPTISGWGGLIMHRAATMSEMVPEVIGEKLKPLLLRYINPKPATVYRVVLNDLWCKSGIPINQVK